VTLSQNEADLASVSCLDDRVRDRLYAFVSSRGEPVRRDEAAAAVGIGRALAVYHLDKLVESGLLTASYQRPLGRGGPGAGRPAKVYSRSRGEFMVTVPHREYQLAARLLVQAVAADRSGQARAALHGSWAPASAKGTGPIVPRATACSGPWKARCLSTASNHGMTITVRSGCAIAHSAAWRTCSPRWSAR